MSSLSTKSLGKKIGLEQQRERSHRLGSLKAHGVYDGRCSFGLITVDTTVKGRGGGRIGQRVMLNCEAGPVEPWPARWGTLA